MNGGRASMAPKSSIDIAAAGRPLDWRLCAAPLQKPASSAVVPARELDRPSRTVARASRRPAPRAKRRGD